MRLASAILLLSLGLTACSSNDTESVSPVASGENENGFGDPIQGEILAVEANDDNKVEVGVTDEVVFFRLTEEARAEVSKEIDAEGEGGGLGGAITDMVGGVVDRALATTAQMPLAEVEAMRYVDGHLVIDGADGGLNISIGDNGDEGIPFDADAAQRLIAAFERAR